jgi:hypothetical protein
MRYTKTLICQCSALLFYVSALAQQSSIKDLRAVFDRLKTVKTYSFENHTDAVFANGQKDAAVTKVFMDKAKQCLFYTNKGETFLLTPHWVYKASHIKKTAQVFDLAAYNKRTKKAFPVLQTIFQYDMVSGFVDSVVMKHGKLLSVKKEGALTTYQIGFAPEAAIKQLTIVYNESAGLPESVYIRTVVGDGKRKMQSEILCNNYKSTIPAAIFDEHNYFSVQQGKVALTQYKDYKVYPLL